MNKFLYTLPAAALLMVSCSDEIPGTESYGDGNVNYKISVPATFNSRAYGDGQFGDGTTARNLQYAVYDIENGVNTLITTGTAVFDNEDDKYKTTNVSLNLAKGRAYNIVFFAQAGTGAAGSLYEFNTAENSATIKVDYSKAEANSDQADCFYTLETTGVVSGPINKPIVLTRPVAQINWGSDDVKQDVVTHTTAYDKDDNGEVKNYWSKMTTKAYTAFDLLAGNVTGEEESVVFNFAQRPATTYTFPVTKEDASAAPYKYLRMAYLFVQKEQHLIDLTLEHSKDGSASMASVNVTGAPVQANYRTNIFGSLLTSPSNFFVTKEEYFGGDNPVFAAQYTGADGQNFTDMLKENNVLEVYADGTFDLTGFDSGDGKARTLVIQNNDVTLKLGDNQTGITVKVGKDVDYPKLTYTKNSIVKDFTLKGDLNSSKKFGGMYYYQIQDAPKTFVNITVEDVAFDGHGFEPWYTYGFENAVFKNCTFENCPNGALNIQQTGSSVGRVCKDLTVTNCVITKCGGNNQNALYLLDVEGELVVSNNIITNTPEVPGYIGISISRGGTVNDTGLPAFLNKIVIEGNKVKGNKADGIKIDSQTKATVVINNNEVASGKNGIRFKNSIDGNNITVTNNTVDITASASEDWVENDGEPSAILFYNKTENATPATIVVDSNTIIYNTETQEGRQITYRNINKN